MALNKCIVLFDEIEEFALDRENPGLSMESRMLTTAMLTAINDLRRSRQCIFFIATNRLRAFDSAITRPGRFDMQLFVGTPNLVSRVNQFREMLPNTLDSYLREEAVQAFQDFLRVVWTQDVMFMNYLEAVQFASSCADVVVSTQGRLTNENMSSILKQQAAVMTVRGAAPREEYLSSMALSRY
jgi:SpoVK/Ycf46/Vps4 family AAA+-type ATPase